MFTARSTGIGIVTSVIVAAGLGQLLGVAWKLATLNGLAAGALALALSTIGGAPSRRGFRPHAGRFGMMDNVRWPGIWALVVAVIAGPMFFVDIAIGIEFHQKFWPESFAVKSLFGLAGAAAYCLGGIMATLNQLADGVRPSPQPRQDAGSIHPPNGRVAAGADEGARRGDGSLRRGP